MWVTLEGQFIHSYGSALTFMKTCWRRLVLNAAAGEARLFTVRADGCCCEGVEGWHVRRALTTAAVPPGGCDNAVATHRWSTFDAVGGRMLGSVSVLEEYAARKGTAKRSREG